MAKQQPRPKSKAPSRTGRAAMKPPPAKPKPRAAKPRAAKAIATRPAKPTKPTKRTATPAAAKRAAKPVATSSSAPKRATYVDAVALYEDGIDALQRHNYTLAIKLLERVLSSFPEERELHERVRLYLNVCQRHAAPRAAAPRTVQERLYASTLALNGGRYDEAISHLRLVRDEDPDNDHALYMLAVAHAQRGEHAQSIVHLERAISLNPENRARARRDQDLDSLGDDEAFHRALEPVSRRRS